MLTPKVCRTCGTVLTPDVSPDGLCPSCLFAQALSFPSDPVPEDEASSRLEPCSTFGPFRIEALLGEGGMSTVYRARETALDRVVALKVLPPEFLHDATFARRFQQEARVVARLDHPHIVPIFAAGIEAGIPWMSMRLMPGGSLETLLRDGDPDRERIVAILRDVAVALDYAHAHGVVHRDVKPSNILLDQAEAACISDFGLAHLVDGSAVHTRTGTIAGTPHYMSPEQGLGRAVDHRADLYSLGVVAYEMLAGRRPFNGDSPVAILMKHASAPVPVPARDRVPSAMLTVLSRALAKDPDARWPTATAFVTALANSGRATTPLRRVRSTVLWGGGLAAGAAIGIVTLLPPARGSDQVSVPEIQLAPSRDLPTAASPIWPPAVVTPSGADQPATLGARRTPPVLPAGAARTADPPPVTRGAVPDAQPKTDSPGLPDPQEPADPGPVPRPDASQAGSPGTETASPSVVAPAAEQVIEPVRNRTVNSMLA